MITLTAEQLDGKQVSRMQIHIYSQREIAHTLILQEDYKKSTDRATVDDII